MPQEDGCGYNFNGVHSGLDIYVYGSLRAHVSAFEQKNEHTGVSELPIYHHVPGEHTAARLLCCDIGRQREACGDRAAMSV
eukprot:4606944-Lingulodinium_polyedra.AAC.1